MAAYGSRVRQHRAVADMKVMRDMHVRHEEVVVSDRRLHTSALCAAVDRHKFPDSVSVPNDCRGALPLVFQFLWRDTDCGIGIKNIIPADSEGTLHEHMPPNLR